MRKFILLCLIYSLSTVNLQALTIAEKKAGITPGTSDLSPDLEKLLTKINEKQAELQKKLHETHDQVLILYHKNAPDSEYEPLLEQIHQLQVEIETLQTDWRETAATSAHHEDGYALWHQPQTTLEELIADFGSQHYVYLLSPDVAGIKLSINSNLPIPRSSWDEMLEIILAQNGVAIKQLNPYLRELYLIQEDRSNLKLITNQRHDLDLFPNNERIGFMLSPEPSEVRHVWNFLDKFMNAESSVLQMIGRDILILGKVSEIRELLKLYDFVSANRGDRDYKVVTLSRVNMEEMAKILEAVFDQLTESSRSSEQVARSRLAPGGARREVTKESLETNGLKIIPLSQITQALFLIGTQEEIKKAENIIREVEEQVGESKKKTIFWYTTKHSIAEELADVLEKIYDLLVNSDVALDQGDSPSDSRNDFEANQPPPEPRFPMQPIFPFPSREKPFYLDKDAVVNPTPEPRKYLSNDNRSNFIVDAKTGSIIMVVEAEMLPKLKDLLKKLDVPKKMVQIEILLFEKKVSKENKFGLNLLKVGHAASNKSRASALWHDLVGNKHSHIYPQPQSGIFDFFLSQAKHSGIPAYDLAYRFMLSQDDVQINASPSILTINQTEAIIELVDEISVNTGVTQFTETGSVEKNYQRATYGIKIGVTPTIHASEDNQNSDDPTNYITLATDISFQTFKKHNDSRPDVTTRKIINEVRIPDGQTVILGGLRSRSTQDNKDSIPFLGEIPGFGKLFSSTSLLDQTTEMFIFITPKIIADPSEDLEKLRNHEMTRRPGDIPEFINRLVLAQEDEKNRFFQGTLNLLFGAPTGKCGESLGEYDGRSN